MEIFRTIVFGLGAVAFAATVSAPALAQAFPELLYYQFNETTGTTTANLAQPGVGTTPAPVNGYTMGGTGQFGGGLRGAVGTGATHFVDTGWVTALGTGSWTLSFWFDNRATNPGGALQYLCCDLTAGSFRIFSNGVAGAENLILRGTGITDVTITGGASYTAVAAVAWVYDSSVPEIRAYLNGVKLATVPQAAALTINGTANFKVGGYGTSPGLLPNGVVDEFRLYSRALSDAEIAATWNVDIGSTPVGLMTFSVD